MAEFNERNREIIYSIVSNFSEIINYKESIKNSKSFKNFLMLAGGSTTERDACIDYLTDPPFGNLIGLPELGRNGNKQKHRIDINFKCMPYQIESFIDDIKKLDHANKKGNNCKLILLKEFTYASNATLSIFTDIFKSLIKKQVFIIATAGSKESLQAIPSQLLEIFETKYISCLNHKTEKKYFPSKTEIDSILQNFINEYPNKSREFIARRAITSIKNEFPKNKLYGKNTLISRISNIRKNTKSMELSDFNT